MMAHGDDSSQYSVSPPPKRRRQLNPTTPQLTMADHHQVTKFLRDLDNDQLIGVGVALGLYRPSLKRMKDLSGDMVAAWLREDDNVTVASGSPSWTSLAMALEDIGHKGLAAKIRKVQAATPHSPEMSSALSHYRNYLKSYYNINPVARDDKLSIAPCSEFISLELVIEDGAVPLELDAILTSNSEFVLVEGGPGIGKSTLSWELCRKWDTLKSLQHYSIVLLLKLRERRVQNATSLNELFYHRDRALCESVVSEVLRREGEGVLLIMDGFDEMPVSLIRNKEILIMEIISGVCIPRATRLVTSRPSAFHCKKYFPERLRHVKIVGFNDENVEKFAEITFASEPQVLSEFKKFIFSNPIIKSLMCIPVNCAILAQSFKEIMRSSRQVPKTTTQLYSMLTRILIRRHLIAIGRWDEDFRVSNDLKDLPDDVKGNLERVSKLAYTGLFKEDVQLVFTDSDVGEEFHPLDLLSEVKEMYVFEGARTSYSFLHLSIQEFLAAWHVSCHQELVEETLAKTLTNNPHLHVFGHILAGLIGITDLYFSYLRKWHCDKNFQKILHMCHCFYEAQYKSDRDVFDTFDTKEIVPITLMDMYVFGYCLAYIPHNWPKIFVLMSSFDMLVSSLNDHARNDAVLGSIEKLELNDIFSSSFPSLVLKDLPQSLLNSVKHIHISTSSPLLLFEGTPLLPCLQSLYWDNIGNIHGFTQWESEEAMQCLNNALERGSRGLCGTLSNSTIEDVTLHLFSECNVSHHVLDPVINAALSCPSLKSLTTQLPFFLPNCASPKNNNLQKIHVGHITQDNMELPEVVDCLFSIANQCRAAPSLEYLLMPKIIELGRPYSTIFLPCDDYDCISLLNICLNHHWPSMKSLYLPFCFRCTEFELSNLSSALRRDPDASFSAVRRSESLSDLNSVTLDKNFAEELDLKQTELTEILDQHNHHVPPVKKTQSCPDLVGIQSLHPLLKVFIKIEDDLAMKVKW